MEEVIKVFIYTIITISGIFLAGVVIWTALTIFMYAKKPTEQTIVKKEETIIKHITTPAPVAEPTTILYGGFWITRKEIAEDVRNLKNKDITVIEHLKNPQLPTSLKWKTKTFALLYVSDEGPLMIARISDELGKELAKTNPKVSRAVFPKGNNWYSIPVDQTFENKAAVYKVISQAQEFVTLKPTPKPKSVAPKVAKPKTEETKTKVKKSTTKK